MRRTDVVAGAAACGALIAVASITGVGRRLSGLDHDLSNLGQIARWTQSYAADHEDQFWGFTWRAFHRNSQWGDLNNSPTDSQATADQAVDILRRRGRPDMPRITGWMASVNYSHLPLLDWMEVELPSLMFVSTGDANRLDWARDPAGFDEGKFGSRQPPPSPTNKRWPYSASYRLSTMFYDIATAPTLRVTQGEQHNQYFIPGNHSLSPRLISEVAHPAEKVHLHDAWGWHFGERRAFQGFEEARVAMLFVDGSASARVSGESNRGWDPQRPTSPGPKQYRYVPPTWEPPVPPGLSDLVMGRVHWTRGTATVHGYVGRDFGGPEPAP